MVCPSGLEETLQGQEYGISAMQGAELNLPADGLGRHTMDIHHDDQSCVGHLVIVVYVHSGGVLDRLLAS